VFDVDFVTDRHTYLANVYVCFCRYEKYARDGNTYYAIAGYATVYEYYAYPNNIRPRISQMLVLPPFQRIGLGAQLLDNIYRHYASQTRIVDITGLPYFSSHAVKLSSVV
jgi:GNAT superfamily N-acetyltransferase